MKNISFLLILFCFLFVESAQAQLRDDLSSPYDYTGPIINKNVPTVDNALNRFFNSVAMSHSYSMNFSSFRGSYQNVNAYTNTMQFAFSPRLNGRVDVSFLHSPFGGNATTGQSQFQNRIVIQNAELNYRISDKASIHFQYQQLPTSYFGYDSYGYGRYNRYNRFGNSGFWY